MRGPLWWLREHSVAERAVTVASESLDMGGNARYMALWECRLDATLDHLATVEDVCDGIIVGLRCVAPAWIADVAERHYLHGDTWAEAADRCGISNRHAQRELFRALERLEQVHTGR